jgi:hypothetical protein
MAKNCKGAISGTYCTVNVVAKEICLTLPTATLRDLAAGRAPTQTDLAIFGCGLPNSNYCDMTRNDCVGPVSYKLAETTVDLSSFGSLPVTIRAADDPWVVAAHVTKGKLDLSKAYLFRDAGTGVLICGAVFLLAFIVVLILLIRGKFLCLISKDSPGKRPALSAAPAPSSVSHTEIRGATETGIAMKTMNSGV